MLEADLYTKLSSLTALTAIVGTNIYPILAPETQEAPFVTFVRVAETWNENMVSAGNCGWITMDIYGWGATALQALSINEAIITGLLMVKFGNVDGSKLQNTVSFYEAESSTYRTVATIQFQVHI